MLQKLFVKNFVLIDELHLDFQTGLHIFTGETGAGKSIFIDALSLLLGEKFLTSYRKNENASTIVEAVFTSIDEYTKDALVELGFDELDELIVTRIMNPDGKVKTMINQRSISVSFLKEYLRRVVDIHSQHQTQYLLQKKFQLELLDSYINNPILFTNVENSYGEYRKYKKEMDSFLALNNDKDLDYIRFQLQEIEALSFSEEGYLEVSDRAKMLSHFEKDKEHLQQALQRLKGEEDVVTTLYEVHKALQLIDHSKVQELASTVLDLHYGLEECVEQLTDFDDNFEFDEEQFAQDQKYLFDVQKVLRKYNGSVKKMQDQANVYKEQLDQIENAELYSAMLEQKLSKAKENYETFALELQQLRKDVASELEVNVQKELKALYLDHAKFKIIFTEDTPNKSGMDQIEFYIAMNVNQPLQPLKDSASGGELSRFMLALKTIFTKQQAVSTIVFDEIDSGVSGKVAFAIGQKMKEIAQEKQVVTITHLAGVAVFADTHYLVQKEHKEHETITSIRALSKEEVIDEIVALSGHTSSANSRGSAIELLEKAFN